MSENKIHKKISLENFKSRFPGLIPYIDSGDGGNIKFPGKLLSESNWGHIGANFSSSNFNFPESDVVGGKKIYAFKDLEKRYHRMMRLIRDGIFVEKVFDGNREYWVISEKDKQTALSNLPEDMFFDSEEILNGPISKAFVDFELNGEVDVIEKYTDLTEMFIMDDLKYFKDMGGMPYIAEYEKLRGILRVPRDIEGKNVPFFFMYADIDNAYTQMAHIRESMSGAGCNVPGEVIRKYKDLGGDKMYEFLKKYSTDGEDILSKEMEDIKGFEILPPEIGIQIPLVETVKDAGTFEEYDGEIEGAAESNPASGYKPAMTITGESELARFEEKNLVLDENTMESVGGILKENRDGDRYAVCRLQENNIWSLHYVDMSNPENSKERYNIVPTFSLLKSTDSPAIVKYDNGRLLKQEGAPKTAYLLVNEDGSESVNFPDGTSFQIEKVAITSLPESGSELEGKIIELEADMEYTFFEKGDCLIFKGGKWVTFSKPEYVVYQHLPENLISVKTASETRYYSEGNREVFVSMVNADGKSEFYAAEEAKVPYIEFIPSNKIIDRYNPEFFYTADFLISVERTEDEIEFRYTFGCPCNIKDGKVTGFKDIENIDLYQEKIIDDDGNDISFNDDGKCGIFYREKYRLGRHLSREIKIDDKSFNYIYEKALFDDGITEISDESSGLKRNVKTSEIKFRPDGLWHNESTVSLPLFKASYLENAAFVNKPDIDVIYNRGNATAFEPKMKLMECNSIEDLENYGNNYFNIR